MTAARDQLHPTILKTRNAIGRETGARVRLPDAPPKQPDSFESGLFVLVGGTGREQQRRRPPPAAETGSRGWGRVLIFQSPAKGLRKNQQMQPVQAPAVRFRQGSQRLGMSTKKDAARPFGLGTFFVVDGTGREPERAKAGYHHDGGILPFALICFISRSQHPLQYSLRENSP